MKDIADNVDRVKAICEAASGRPAREGLTEAETNELLTIGIDFVGELVANSRRVATALESIAKSLESIDLHTSGSK